MHWRRSKPTVGSQAILRHDDLGSPEAGSAETLEAEAKKVTRWGLWFFGILWNYIQNIQILLGMCLEFEPLRFWNRSSRSAISSWIPVGSWFDNCGALRFRPLQHPAMRGRCTSSRPALGSMRPPRSCSSTICGALRVRNLSPCCISWRQGSKKWTWLRWNQHFVIRWYE